MYHVYQSGSITANMLVVVYTLNNSIIPVVPSIPCSATQKNIHIILGHDTKNWSAI